MSSRRFPPPPLPHPPSGCTAGFYTGPEYDPGAKARGKPPKWHPHPKPSERQCEWPQFVPMGCHKCWYWNFRTWKHMRRHCPEAVRMRALRAKYRVGIEFTGWPTRPRVTPLRGTALPDRRWPPIDIQQGHCRRKCGDFMRARKFETTKLGLYHK